MSRIGETDRSADARPERDDLLREEAIKQIDRRRRFKTSTVLSALGRMLLTVIWGISEYYNAGGWPTEGFSQSSGIPHVWNIWIIYPLIAWAFIPLFGAWNVYMRKPITEREIDREIERQTGHKRAA